MKLVIKCSANQSIVEKLIKHFGLLPKIHAVTYYTEAECFKMTWNFEDEAEMNTAKSWTEKIVPKGTEVYNKVDGDDFFMTVKFHGHQKLKDLEKWLDSKATKQYFANQNVYRFYFN